MATKKSPDKEIGQPETVYGREELVAAASVFGVRAEVVAGALRLAGRTEMTKSEMVAALAAFLRREV